MVQLIKEMNVQKKAVQWSGRNSRTTFLARMSDDDDSRGDGRWKQCSWIVKLCWAEHSDGKDCADLEIVRVLKAGGMYDFEFQGL